MVGSLNLRGIEARDEAQSPEPVSVYSVSSPGSAHGAKNPLLKNLQTIGHSLWQNLFKGDEALQNDPSAAQDFSSFVKVDGRGASEQG